MKKAKKSLSQNFINDKNICNKILNQVTIRDKKIIEIGPGYGFLTDLIIKRNPSNLLLIEKDNQLCNLLKEKYKKLKNIYIQNIDAIDFEYDTTQYELVTNYIWDAGGLSIDGTNEVIVPKISACFFDNFPVGIGLRQVLDISESRSASYQQFNAPAAPEPSATAIMDSTA